jgi:hypothetical protein
MRSILLLAMILAAGCSTQPVSNEDADVVQASGFSTPIEGGGRLIVKRDRGMMGGGCKASIYLNGQHAVCPGG